MFEEANFDPFADDFTLDIDGTVESIISTDMVSLSSSVETNLLDSFENSAPVVKKKASKSKTNHLDIDEKAVSAPSSALFLQAVPSPKSPLELAHLLKKVSLASIKVTTLRSKQSSLTSYDFFLSYNGAFLPVCRARFENEKLTYLYMASHMMSFSVLGQYGRLSVSNDLLKELALGAVGIYENRVYLLWAGQSVPLNTGVAFNLKYDDDRALLSVHLASEPTY